MVRIRISRVFVIISFVALLQISGTILLARNLPKADMGFWRLLLTLIEMGTLFGLLGIDHSFVRFFSPASVSIQEYDWKSFLNKFFILSSAIIFIVSAIAASIYKLSLPLTLFLIISAIMSVSVFIFASFLRAKQKYELAIFFSRSNFLIFFIIFMVIYALKAITLKTLAISYLFSIAIANIVIIHYLLKKTPNGTRPIPRAVLINGLYYFGMGIAIILMLQLGNLTIGKILSYKDLAVYVVIASVMRLFEFIQDSSYYVLAPHLNQESNIPFKKIFSVIFLVGLITSFLYLLFAKSLVHILFAGLYDEGLYLVPFFIGIGFVRTLFVLPASIIGGKSSEAVLKNQFLLTCAAASLNFVLILVFITKWQLRGVALANLISWSLLFIASLFLTKKYIVFTDTNEAISV